MESKGTHVARYTLTDASNVCHLRESKWAADASELKKSGIFGQHETKTGFFMHIMPKADGDAIFRLKVKRTHFPNAPEGLCFSLTSCGYSYSEPWKFCYPRHHIGLPVRRGPVVGLSVAASAAELEAAWNGYFAIHNVGAGCEDRLILFCFTLVDGKRVPTDPGIGWSIDIEVASMTETEAALCLSET